MEFVLISFLTGFVIVAGVLLSERRCLRSRKIKTGGKAKQKLYMTELYDGNKPEWKGWHHLFLDLGGPKFDKCIAGPIDPETSAQLKAALGID